MNALPVEPVKKIVSASTGWFVVMSRTPQPCASVTLPSSTMAIATPGTPNCLRSCSTRCSNPAGGAALAVVAPITNASPLNARWTCFNMDLLLEWIRLGLERQRLHVRGSLATTTEKPTAVTRRWQVLHNIGWCAPASISRNLVRSCHWYGWHSYACTSHLVMGRLRWSGPDGAVQTTRAGERRATPA